MDTEFKNTSREKNYRKAKARFDPSWHFEQVKECARIEDWFGATFHVAWLLKENTGWLNLFKDGYAKLKAQFKEEGRDLEDVLPLVVKEAIKLIPETKPADELNGDDDE